MKNTIDINIDNKIATKNAWGHIEIHNKETYTKVWKRECNDFYNLASTKDDFDTVECFRNNIELMASRQFDKMLEKQKENPLEINDEKIMDRTK